MQAPDPYRQHPGQTLPWPAAGRPIDADGTWPLDLPGGPCRTWPLEPGCGCLPPDPVDWTEPHLVAIEAATEILWGLSAGRYGLCRETIRPCADPPPDPAPRRRGYRGPMPAIVAGAWRNLSCGCSPTLPCACGPLSTLTLPGPVYTGVPGDPAGRFDIEVWIDGTLLVTGWRLLRDGRGERLVRTDGGRWPDCQHIERPWQELPEQPGAAAGTVAVRYWRGQPVPVGGRRAVAILACELWKKCTGAGDCRIPDRVYEVEREGLTYRMIDPQRFLREGRTGVTEVDLWISTVNPRGRRSPATVYSPDMPVTVLEHTTGQYPGEPP